MVRQIVTTTSATELDGWELAAMPPARPNTSAREGAAFLVEGGGHEASIRIAWKGTIGRRVDAAGQLSSAR
jgi:hypothetical protein